MGSSPIIGIRPSAKLEVFVFYGKEWGDKVKFRKLSENKIHCIITQEEMFEKGIEIEDFLERRDKTEDFLREIVTEASYELNLDEMGYYYNVQMSIMPEGDVSLVISSEDMNSVGDALTEFGKRLQDFKEIMSAAKKELDAARKHASEKKAEGQPAQGGREQSDGKKEDPLIRCPLWIRTDSLEHCIAIAKNIHNLGPMESALYKYDGEYYMRLLFSHRERQIAGAIIVASEYAIETFTEEQGGDFLLEHGEAICKKEAIETLKQL